MKNHIVLQTRPVRSLLENPVLGGSAKPARWWAAILALTVLASPVAAANLYWVGTNVAATVGAPGNGNWDLTTMAWDNTTGGAGNPANSVYIKPSGGSTTANFNGTGSCTATLTANLTSNNIVYFNSGMPTIAGAFSISVQNTLSLQFASGMTATVDHVTFDVNTGSYTVGKSGGTAAGTLILTNGAVVRSNNSGYGVAIDGSGALVDVLTGCIFGVTSSGTGGGTLTVSAGAGSSSTLQIDGGTAQVAGVNQNFIVGSGGSGTLTLNSGSATMPVNSVKSLTLASGFGSTGTVNLNGGTLSISNAVKFLGDLAVFNFNGGTLKANQNCAAFISGLDAANVLAGGAIINNNGKNITISQALLNGTNVTDGGLTSQGAGTLTLSGANTYNGPTKLIAGKLVTTTDSTGGGDYVLNDGTTFEVQVNNPGASLINSSLTLGTAGTLTYNFTLGGSASATIPAVTDTGALNLNGTVTVNVTATGLAQGTTNVLLSYGSLAGSGSFVAGTLPTVDGSTVTLVNDIANKQLELVVIATPVSVQWSVGDGDWDTTTSNWQPLGGGAPTDYAEYAFTTFDDSASGSSPITVTLTANHTPTVVNNNSSKDYILGGTAYNLSGASLTKNGTGTLTLDNGSGNSFTSVTINNGTLQVGNNDTGGSLGASAVANNGALTFKRTDALSVANVISGSGSVTQNGGGALTLSGANSYSGLTTIAGGQLVLGNNAAAQNSVVSNHVANGLGFASGITNAAIGGLAGAGNITLSNVDGAAVTLMAGGANVNNAYDGRLSGGTLAKTGTGTLTLTGNSTVDNLTVGNAANGGTLQLANGVSLTVGSGTNSSLLVGVSDASARSGTLDASLAASLTANVGILQVGYGLGTGTGQGTLDLAMNNTLTAGTVFSVGRSEGTYNNVNSSVVTPGGSTTTIQTPLLAIGHGKGRGSFTLGAQSTLTVTGLAGSRAALSVGSTSIAGGSGSWSGSLDASAGSFNGSLSSLVVGFVNTDGGSSQTENAAMTLSTNAANHLDISGPGSVVAIGEYQLGTSANAAVGTLTIGNLDAGSRVVSTDNGTAILIGTGGTNSQHATGMLTLNGGNLTITTTGTGIGGDTANPNNVSLLNLNGATLQAGTNSSTFINGLTSANVLSNGVAFNDGGYIVTVPQALQAGDANNGGLAKAGAGVLTLSGNSTYTGTTTVSNGSLVINGSVIGDARAAAGTLGGNGSIGGSVTVNAGGTLAPGFTGVGTLTIAGNLALNGNLAFAVDKSLVTSNGFCVVSGTLQNTGSGTLLVTNLGPALVAGDKFTLFNQPLVNGNTLTIIPPQGVTFTNHLAVDGSIQVLMASGPATNPTNITVQVSGNTLSLSWPADHLGWVAQSNSASLTSAGSWFDIPNSQNGTNLVITFDPGLTNVFYRLRAP